MAEADSIIEEVEERAGEKLGLERWDRPAIFREAAGAATSTDLAYWMVLMLSGLIATLGLALNSSAVVIGAMLIAPLLAPVVGLALALAVGDGRLLVQTAAVVLASTLAVVAAAALVTLLLPFQTITPEITARTRPTTLDLAVAVASGLAGVLVTVARENRLSAAIPGVAIAVALIPPLGVAGFGIGAGWNWRLIYGSLLLYGANLAGIVLSGMLVFLLVGMHRDNVLAAARRWHTQDEPSGLVAWVTRLPWVRSLGLMRSLLTRTAMVLGFVLALAVPLSHTLSEVAREVRVRGAVEAAMGVFQVPGRSSVVSEQMVSSEHGTQVFLRVATAEWFGEEDRQEFVRRASAAAHEPVRLVLEQLPATSGDVEQLAGLLTAQDPRPVVPPPPPQPTRLPGLLSSVRQRVTQALSVMALPDGVALAGTELLLSGVDGARLRVAYAAERSLPPEAEQVLTRQLARALGDPAMRIELVHLSTRPFALDDDGLSRVRDLLQRFSALGVVLLAGPADTASVREIRDELTGAGLDSARVGVRVEPGAGMRARLHAGRPASTGPGAPATQPPG